MSLGGGSGWVILNYNSRDNAVHNYWAADHSNSLAWECRCWLWTCTNTPTQWITVLMRWITSMFFFKTLIGMRLTGERKQHLGNSDQILQSPVSLLQMHWQSSSFRSASSPALSSQRSCWRNVRYISTFLISRLSNYRGRLCDVTPAEAHAVRAGV